MRIVSQQALQVAINSAKTGSGAQAIGSFVPMRRATIQVSDTIRISDVKGTRPWGDALGGTTIEWVGTDASKPIFLIDGCDAVDLGYFTVKVSAPCASIFKITDQGAGTSPIRSTRINIHDVDVDNAFGAVGTIIYVALTADEGKNDQHVFARVTAKGYSHSFARLEGQAAVGIRFDECRAQSREYGQHSIYAKHDTLAGRGGQFTWTGGLMMEHSVADIRGDWRNGACYVNNPKCEQSARFLVIDSAGASFSGNNFTVVGGEWVNNIDIHPVDEEVIQVDAGALNIMGMTFGQAANVNGTDDCNYRFRYNPAAAKRLGWNFTGNTVWTPLAAGWFTGLAPDSKVGSYARTTAAGPSIAM